VTSFERENPETPFGQAMYGNLLGVHAALRSDLAVVEDLTADLDQGVDAAEIRERVVELKTSGPLWKLKTDCLQFCSFLHAHHSAEDAKLFPRLRQLNPELTPAVARLESDHAVVADMLIEIETTTDRLSAGAPARNDLARLLSEMRGHLLEHLEFEEQVAGPTIRRMVSFD
jgi:iron-sulfur cluster repair protein YtfE (RIC family)